MKNVSVQPQIENEDVENWEEEIVGTEEENNDSGMRKNGTKIPKEPEYFTYETIEDDVEGARKNASNSKKYSSQMVENEEENKEKLTLTEEEIYKGVIYSEILKKKFN